MERMTKIDENIQTAQNLLSGIVERCYELEEENKKLKEQNGDMFDRIMRDEEYEDSLEEHVRELEEENKNLREELSKKSMETWFDKKQHSMGFSDFGGYDLDSNK